MHGVCTVTSHSTRTPPRNASEQPSLPPLRPYQLDGVKFLLTSDSALLADEMGLGKTIQAATALREARKHYRRVLIVAPASLCLNWQRELETWAPEITVRRITGTAEDRSYTYRLPIQVLIASFEQIRLDCHDLAANVRFDLVVIDEVQRIKNNNSAQNLACRIIPRQASWALSGTPLENEVNDLVSVFGFVRPGLLRSDMTKQEIHAAMKPHFLRRTRAEVLSELPPISIREMHLELGYGQRKAYEESWSQRFLAHSRDPSMVASSLLALLTRLKQICNFDDESGESVKLSALQDILDRVAAMKQKVLIFSQYVDTLKKISRQLSIEHDIYHGGLSTSARDGLLTEFREQSGPRALLISLRSGGVGLNLQEASTVVLFDRWWNPATEDQAIHRAYRYGRRGPLDVIRFLVEDSIEERISSLLTTKSELFDEYVRSAPQDKRWSVETLRQIFDL